MRIEDEMNPTKLQSSLVRKLILLLHHEIDRS